MNTTSKPITATADELELAEAYAVLRQVKYYLALEAPRPRATEEVRKAVAEFCLNFELRHHPRKAAAEMPTTTPTTETQP